MNTKIKDWYTNTYPEDKLGIHIDGNYTFYKLFEDLDSYKEIYTKLADDSVIRERVFKKLAILINTSYDYIYDQWLMGEEE